MRVGEGREGGGGWRRVEGGGEVWRRIGESGRGCWRADESRGGFRRLVLLTTMFYCLQMFRTKVLLNEYVIIKYSCPILH